MRTHLGGRDLVGKYVAACRASGLRVGLYFSGADWWLDRAYRNFNYRSPGEIDTDSSRARNQSLLTNNIRARRVSVDSKPAKAYLNLTD